MTVMIDSNLLTLDHPPAYPRHVRRNLRRGQARIAACGLTPVYTFPEPAPPLLAELAGAYAARCAAADPPRPVDWCWWATSCDLATEAGILRVGGHLAAWTLHAAHGTMLRVLAGQMVTGFAWCFPGRLLEAELISRARQAGYTTIDWGPGHPSAVICADPRLRAGRRQGRHGGEQDHHPERVGEQVGEHVLDLILQRHRRLRPRQDNRRRGHPGQ
jgi:hypothetical protein